VRAEISKALVVVTQHPAIPGASRWTLRILNLVAAVAALGGVAYAFFGGWYWALIGIAAMLIIGRVNQRTAAEIVMGLARSNSTFKAEMLRSGVIIEQ
jgi:hypothetical protein